VKTLILIGAIVVVGLIILGAKYIIENVEIKKAKKK
jgi:hypothetical protein